MIFETLAAQDSIKNFISEGKIVFMIFAIYSWSIYLMLSYKIIYKAPPAAFKPRFIKFLLTTWEIFLEPFIESLIGLNTFNFLP